MVDGVVFVFFFLCCFVDFLYYFYRSFFWDIDCYVN